MNVSNLFPNRLKIFCLQVSRTSPGDTKIERNPLLNRIFWSCGAYAVEADLFNWQSPSSFCVGATEWKRNDTRLI